MRGMGSVLAVLAIVSCERLVPHGSPARLVVGRTDTVIVNSRHAIQLPVRVVDSAGRQLPPTGVRYVWVSGEPLAVSGSGRVTCPRRLDAEVRVSLGTLSHRFTVLCRPIQGFSAMGGIDRAPFLVDGPPATLVVPAVGLGGERVRQISGTLTVKDTTVAVARDDRLYPRAPGVTSVVLDIGDCLWAVGFEVVQRVASPSELRRREQVFLDAPLRLAAGEERTWRLPPGEYRVVLLPVRAPAVALLLGATAMNCVDDGPAHHCIALADASVTVRARRNGAGSAVRADTLLVQRLDVPSHTPQSAPSPSLQWSKTGKRPCRLVLPDRVSRR